MVSLVLLAALAMVAILINTTEDDDPLRPAPLEWPPADLVAVSGGIFSDISSPRIQAHSEATSDLSCVGEDKEPSHATDHKQRAIDVLASVYPVLAATENAELVLAAALLLPLEEFDRADEYLAQASKLSPNSRLVSWNQLLACTGSNDRDCDVAAVHSRAVALDGSNGAVWMKITSDHLAADKEELALDAVRRAIAAPRFDEYWIDHVMLLERAFAASTDWPLADKVIKAIGLVAAMPLPVMPLYDKCRKLGKDAAVWLELCDQLGQKMFDDGRTIITRGIGLGLRNVAADLALNPGRRARVSRLKREFSESYSKLIGQREAANLLFNDEHVMHDYLDNFATYGEFEALTRLAAEVSRLKASPDYDQCNFISNPYGY